MKGIGTEILDNCNNFNNFDFRFFLCVSTGDEGGRG